MTTIIGAGPVCSTNLIQIGQEYLQILDTTEDWCDSDPFEDRWVFATNQSRDVVASPRPLCSEFGSKLLIAADPADAEGIDAEWGFRFQEDKSADFTDKWIAFRLMPLRNSANTQSFNFVKIEAIFPPGIPPSEDSVGNPLNNTYVELSLWRTILGGGDEGRTLNYRSGNTFQNANLAGYDEHGDDAWVRFRFEAGDPNMIYVDFSSFCGGWTEAFAQETAWGFDRMAVYPWGYTIGDPPWIPGWLSPIYVGTLPGGS
jgi:hypothetical protein